MTGSMARLMLRALITVRIRILTDLARTTFRRGILDAWSIVGHGGCECGSTDRERRCGKCDCCLAQHNRASVIDAVGWGKRRGVTPTAFRQANACPLPMSLGLLVAFCRKPFCRSAKCHKGIEAILARAELASHNPPELARLVVCCLLSSSKKVR